MTKAVFFGASTVEGAGASTPSKRFSTSVAKHLYWEEINMGLAGTCVAGRDDDGQVVDEHSGLGRVDEVLEHNPDILLILHGANDFVQSCELGHVDEFRQGTFFWDYDTMLRGLLFALHPGQVVVSTCQYRADANTPNKLGLMLPDYNKAIAEVAARHGVRLLDAFADAGMDNDNWHKLSDDGTHPNDAGHECLAAFFLQAFVARPR